MMSTVVKIDGEEPTDLLDDLSAQEQTMSTVIKVDGEELADLLHDLSAQEQTISTVVKIDDQESTDLLDDLSAQEQTTSTIVKIDSQQPTDLLDDLLGQEQIAVELPQVKCGDGHHGVCAICLSKIILQETALVKGCEHAYCVMCILRWATYKNEPTCPQCKHPFEFLHIHRSLDGSMHDFLFEESVCLLLRASWFKPLVVEDQGEVDDEVEDLYLYEDDGEGLDDVYLASSSSFRIGNRRWGDNGYVRAGRQQARPVSHPNVQGSGAGPSREPKKKEIAKDTVGRRAKRALKREAADKAAAAKHQQHLLRLGRM
ncbi:unnamed protein product [Ilex paraguariensis]|uniref:RING-type domain-containing protein n=1 Tax=Ilex paraguariensis TaxID=185542 RepID=A0ABC8UUP3_9AQUA